MSQLTDNLSAIASIKSDIRAAIEDKGVSMEGVSFGSYADKIGEISGGGGLTQKEVTEKQFEWTVINNSASFVGSFIFIQNSLIQRVSLSECVHIYQQAFGYCSNLSEISLPKCKYVDDLAFYKCSRLAYVDLPECISIPQQTFSDCYAISYVSMPKCSIIYNYAFNNCRSLVDVNLPECTKLSYQAFYNCSSLENISIPKVSALETGVFQNCYKLSELSIPRCGSIGTQCFSGCSSLSQLTVGTETYKVANFGMYCLNGTPFLSGVGSIYVPIDNYDRYVVANGWSSVSARIVGVGDPTATPMLSYSDGLVYGRTDVLYYYFWSDLGVSSNTITAVSLPDCSMFMDYYGTNPGTPLAGLTNLKSVELGTLSSTNMFFFQNCNNLEYVYLPACKYLSSNTFYSCSRALRVVSLPVCEYFGYGGISYASFVSKIELPVCSYIGRYAFYSCQNLEEIYLGYSGVCQLADTDAFTNTPKKSAIYVPESLVDAYKEDSMWSWYSSIIFPALPDLSYRDGLVYGWATSLDPGYLNTLDITASDVTGLSLPRLTSVASSTFMNHYNLTYLNFPNVGEYPDDMFNGCSAFSEFNISASALGDRVFANCAGLERVVIDYQGVIDAGSDLFLNCPNLSQIGLPFGFDSAYYTAPGWSEYSSLFYVDAPLLSFRNGLVYGITSNLDRTFLQTLGITSNQVISVSLPECTSIGQSTFYEFHALKDVYLPKCEYLSRGAFFGANYMNGLDLPVCSYIGEQAFYWCAYSFSYLKLGYSGVCTVESPNAFDSAGPLYSIYVPASLVDAYKSAYVWSRFSNKIFPIE